MIRCASFYLSHGVAFQCVLSPRDHDAAEHIALDTAANNVGGWALVVWTNEMAYPQGLS